MIQERNLIGNQEADKKIEERVENISEESLCIPSKGSLIRVVEYNLRDESEVSFNDDRKRAELSLNKQEELDGAFIDKKYECLKRPKLNLFLTTLWRKDTLIEK